MRTTIILVVTVIRLLVGLRTPSEPVITTESQLQRIEVWEDGEWLELDMADW